MHFHPAIVAVSGASSQLGDALLPRLLKEGHQVVGLSRQLRMGAAHPNFSWRQCSLSEPFGDTSVSCLIHLAPIWLLPAFLEQMAQKKLRIIAVSSCSIHSKANSPSAAEREIASRLREGERALRELAERCGHELTILRPTMLYGLGRDGTVAPLQNFIKRWRCLPFPSLRYGLRQPLHVDDLAKAIISCLNSPVTAGKTYDLGGGERLTLAEIAARIFVDNGLPVRMFFIPRGPLRLLIRLRAWLRRDLQWDSALLDRASQDQLADIEPARADFGFAPRGFDGRFVSRPADGA